MNEYIVSSIQKIIREQKSNIPIIDSLVERFVLYFDRPVHSLSEIRERNTKLKGDIFEQFAKMYFETVLWKGLRLYSDVWLLKDVPQEILNKLGLKRNDLGIDLVLKHNSNLSDTYSAVQVKFRKHNVKYKSKNVIGWKQLSTFYALVKRTGPWKRHIVFTNADYIRHVGKRELADKTIAIGTLRNIKLDQWQRMCGEMGKKLNDEVGINLKLSREQLRELRLKAMS